MAVASEVSKATSVPAFCLFARSRGSGDVAFARQLALYIAHVEMRIPMQQVGEAFGRDRSTVAHACRRLEDMRDDGALDGNIGRIASAVKGALLAYAEPSKQAVQPSLRERGQ